MKNRLGCFAYAMAAAAGLLLGAMGLAALGYFWTITTVLSPDPQVFEYPEWGPIRETALTLKLRPIKAAIERSRQGEYSIFLKPHEANHLISEMVLADPQTQGASVEFGQTAMIISFSRTAWAGRYMNGTLRTAISGQDGDFQVKVFALHTGEYEWPRALFPRVEHYVMEMLLETQKLLRDKPIRLLAISHDREGLRARIRIMKTEESREE